MLQFNVFTIKEDTFLQNSLWAFNFHYHSNPVYRAFCDNLGLKISDVRSLETIPFMPIEFFKHHKILLKNHEANLVFKSSGTTSGKDSRSSHYITNPELYKAAILHSWKFAFGDRVLPMYALLPSYLEQKNSSLIYMIETLKELQLIDFKGYYLYNHEDLAAALIKEQKNNTPFILWGVTFALLDFFESYPFLLSEALIVETGGMKGRRTELTREEVHAKIMEATGVKTVCSEYGMTELLSQCYSFGDGIFTTPPWVRVFSRDLYDPLSILQTQKTAGLNIIDLANIYSCPFIATQDLVQVLDKNHFKIAGRTDNSDIRGCNLMALET